MAVVLDYHPCPSPHLARAWVPPRIVLPLLLIFAHVNLCWQISCLILRSMSGNDPPVSILWCPAIWLPGAAVMGTLGAGPGLLVVVLASAGAGWLLFDVLTRFLAREKAPGGTFAWRFWTLAFLWCAWLPVPGDWSFVGQFRLWAIQN